MVLPVMYRAENQGGEMVTLAQRDPEIAEAILRENERQRKSIVLIASENYASRSVMEAQATVLNNKYATQAKDITVVVSSLT